MLNQVVLVGRLVNAPKPTETENGKTYTEITLAVPRSYKNINGEYDTDFVNCILWNEVGINTSEYCKKGDLIGIKGRMQTRQIKHDDMTENKLELIGERVTYLSSKSKDLEDPKIENTHQI